MQRFYTVTDDFVVSGGRVLALDKSRDIEDYGAKEIVVAGNKYPFELTHMEQWIIVKKADQVPNQVGKTISFV